MKNFLITLLGIGLVTSLPAQVPEDFPPPIKLTAPELDELLGPIALYPDALISLILPAATAPMDIVLAARFVASDGELARINEKPWEPSVRALTRYPDTLSWLDENLEWTSQVGSAFIEQPVEVMESIQHLRGMARALGNLEDTPQQRIVLDDTYIRIVPAQPDYIYEPRYDPYVIYYERPVAVPYLYFSIGFGVGSWLNYDCDWRRHRLYRGDWNEGWDYRRDRDRDNDRRVGGDSIYINNNITNVQEWRPDPVRHRTQSRSVAARISNDTNITNRTQSLDRGTVDSRTSDRKVGKDGRVQSNDLSVNESKKHHERVARPKAIAGSPQHPEGVKRNEQNDRIKGGDLRDRAAKEVDTGKMKDKNTEIDSKGRVSVPKSVAPGMPGDGKGKNKDDARDSGDRKKSGDEPSAVSPTIVVPPMKDGDANKGRSDLPDSKRDEEARQKDAALKEELKRREDSKRNDAPKREEAQKKQELDMPKRAVETREEPAKREETPKREAPKQEESGRKEMPKPQEAAREEPAKRVETPKREAPKQEEADRKEMSKRQEAPQKVEAPKREEPRRQEAPKQEEARKQQEMPKRQETPKQEAPRKVEAPKREEPKRKEAPKRQEPQKIQESPKRPEAARREEPKKEQVKPAGPSAAESADEKKKEEEKKKKK
ncbi:hypothetical protein BH11VER1_BH11VER1_23970 [soil metagenome]